MFQHSDYNFTKNKYYKYTKNTNQQHIGMHLFLVKC